MNSCEVRFICIRSGAGAAAAAAAAAVCVAMLLLLQQQQCCCCFLPLFVIVCWMAKFVAGSLIMILLFSFPSLKTRFSFLYPLAVLCGIYGLDIPTSSVITGMRTARAGVRPPRRSLCCRKHSKPVWRGRSLAEPFVRRFASHRP